MHITSKLLGILPLIVTSLFMSCGQLTFKDDITKSEEPEEEQLKEGHGSMHLSLAKDSFPEGAETLRLYIIAKSDIDCHWIEPFMGGDELAGAGAGLNLAKPVYVPDDCKPPLLYKNGSEEMDEEAGFPAPVEPSLNSIVITLNRGEQIKPIMLRTGSYKVSADFLDESGQLLYYGSEYVSIFDGEKRSVTILLKKIESGELTVGFEVEKPKKGPTRVNSFDAAEFEKKSRDGKTTLVRRIDLNSSPGVAVLTTGKSLGGSPNEGSVRKVVLSKRQIGQVSEVLDRVKLSNPDKTPCIAPKEEVRIKVKSCENCEVGKTYEFSNMGCSGLGFHNMNTASFNELWLIIDGLVTISPKPIATK